MSEQTKILIFFSFSVQDDGRVAICADDFRHDDLRSRPTQRRFAENQERMKKSDWLSSEQKTNISRFIILIKLF